MRNFQKLDPAALKAFYYAAETLNFTKAAEQAALTQSGISQHVAKLEAEIGVNLFHRAARKVQLTEAGQKLKQFTELYLDQIDTLLDSLSTEGTALKGLVRYAMPDSCLMTPHFSILLDKRKNFPGVNLKVTLCDSQRVTELLLKGDIDFGFITYLIPHKDIQYKEFVREEHVLVGPTEKSVDIDNLKDLKAQKFIKYPGMEVLFDNWISTYFPKSTPPHLNDLQICGEMNSLSGAITMVKNNVGLGLFPKHCVANELKSKQLFAYEKSKTKAEQPIYIIQPKEKYPTARVKKVLEIFWQMKP
jgi:DNA-binding transcriptional LysR family regulator